MAACALIELPCRIGRHHPNVQTQGENVAIELPVGHERFRVAKQTATAIDRPTRPAERSTNHTASKSITIPILLSSRPNPSSFSRLLKERYRMARLQVPSRSMRLPTAKDQRARPKKAQSIPLTNRTKRRGRPPKASIRAATEQATHPKKCGGSLAQPIMIPEDDKPVFRPEKAPITYVDHLLWPSERLVTPEISSFQYTPADDRSPRIRVPPPVQEFCYGSSSKNNPILSYEQLPHTAIEVHKDGPRPRTGLQSSQPLSSPAASGSGWAYEQHELYEIVSSTPTRTTPMPILQRPIRDPSFFSPVSTRSQSVHTSVEEELSSDILELADIMNIQLRLKVARLLAIAPELPIRDLCNLLIGTKGNVGKARESMFRQAAWSTGLPPTLVHAKKVKPEVEDVLQYHSGREDAVMVHDSDGDDEEIMAKLEMDDPELWYDNGLLESPAPTIRNSKKTRLPKKNKAPPQFTLDRTNDFPMPPVEDHSIQSPSGKPDRRVSLSSPPLQAPTYPTPSDTSDTPVSEYRPSKGPVYSSHITSPKGPRSKARRSNSIDNVFVMLDTDMESDLDGIYEDSHQGADTEEDELTDEETAGDVDMEDLQEELDIDMSRPFGSSNVASEFGEP
ncbi:hypothetical protein P171DRAFT_469140 [Karstenula rhodostoma CBS 690.94]|uniref:Uncharacterized protein n=1 Tax=Karstenula rhodostoma CBS 690.94 TaxID=1392251 RepID=A0A9P4PVF2_9PLEO|nr:hypothetical protein P171DRAFT_469140 [Karstenula rhodostoma CBS 690.94]